MLKFIFELLLVRKKIIKFVVSGVTAVSADLLFLSFFTEIIGIYYLVSAIMAFFIAFFVSFFMQKFWTFEDNNTERIHRQMIFYFIIAAINLTLNTSGIYWLVEHMRIHYIFSQIFVSGILGINSYLFYNLWIFKKIVAEEIQPTELIQSIEIINENEKA
jgi:putative flippase GtrA